MTTEFNTIALLRASAGTPAANDIAFVKGYYASADGGEGYFYWNSTSTATDNDGTIIKQTSISTGRWLRMFEDIIQVKWFGATGTGTVDDYPGISKAIIFARSEKKELYFSPGTYAIGTTLTLKTDAYLKGDSRTSVLIVPYSTFAGGALTASIESNITVQNMSFNNFLDDFNISRIINITIDNVGVNNATKSGIYVKSSQNVTIQNCSVQTVGGWGIAIDGATGSNITQDTLIVNNLVKDTTDSAINVRCVGGSVTRVMVNNNEIVNAGKHGINHSIDTNANPPVTFNDAVISNNIIVNWGTSAAGNAINLSTANAAYNHINNCTVTGNAIRADSTYNANHVSYINILRVDVCTVTGNSCYGNSAGVAASGISCTTGNEITITGNIVEYSCQGGTSTDADGGILLSGSKNITVTGNIVKNTGKSSETAINRPGIYLVQTTNSTVNGNICFDDRTPAPAQSCGIEEKNDGNCKDNFFGTNSCYGNVSAVNLYSRYSIVYDSMPVQVQTADASVALNTHATFIILPTITAARTLTIELPSITNNLNYGTLTIWNKNNSANTWLIATSPGSTVLNGAGTTITTIPNTTVSTLHFNGTSWVIN